MKSPLARLTTRFTLLALLTACGDKPTDTATPLADNDGDGWFSDEDCDDSDPAIHPGASELCDDVDSDCDGDLDDEEATDTRTWYADADADGYGDIEATTSACFLPAQYVSNSADCDDGNAGVYPGADEPCDGVDNDCDGTVDEPSADSGTWYQDADGDGFGDADSASTTCDPAGDYVSDGGDCDDDDPSTWPGAPQGCDGADHDCDGAVDNDSDGDGYPDAACGGSDCDDTDASRYPTAPEVCGDGVVNDCDETEAEALATCLGEVDLAAADAKLVGERKSDHAGSAVSAAGDMNGDGLADILVGAPGYDLGDEADALDAGAAYLLLSPLSGTISLATAHARLTGEAGGDDAGISVAGLGDIDNDGFDDLVVGAYGEGESGAGAAYVVSGPISGDISLSAADAKLIGGPNGARAGWAVSSAGDLDGDGLGDLLVGDPHHLNAEPTEAGAAYLVLGPISGTSLLSSAAGVLLAESGGDSVGCSVAGVGDVNGDGLDDALVGAENWRAPDGINKPGAAFLLLGAARSDIAGFSLSAPDALLQGEGSLNKAGCSVAGPGDVNGDGLDDLLIGAYQQGPAGAAYLLYGPVSGEHVLSVADATLNGTITGEDAGYSVSGAGDANGDGLPDLLIGAYYSGSTYLVLGPVYGSLDLSLADAHFLGEQLSDYAGKHVSGAGDTNGDGLDDLLIGASKESSFASGAGAAYLLMLGDEY